MVKILIFCETEQSLEITKIALEKKVKHVSVYEVTEESRMSGDELRKIRQDLHMTQEEFANSVTATAQSAISRMEAGLLKVSPEVAEAALSATKTRK